MVSLVYQMNTKCSQESEIKEMANYEIREDNSNKYWPFIVVNVETNEPVRDRFDTREDAQKRIDLLNAPFDDDLLSVLLDEYEGEPMSEKPHEKPEEEAEFVSGVAHKIGDEITDEDGNIYVAIQPSSYVSAADAADFEDGWDAQVSVGWHTPARLKSQSTEVIVEQIQIGQAEIVRHGGVTHVLFHDENQSIPLSDLAYSSELGLYQKSK